MDYWMKMGVRTENYSALNSSFLFLLMFRLHQSQHCCAEVYNITTSQPLAQGQTRVSLCHIFELGFFSPNNIANKYVGIWHSRTGIYLRGKLYGWPIEKSLLQVQTPWLD
ncbi:putative non-specific serine/threonine protein kinase [Rosa chinensis]|uniref:Putative non-specific serine/threonine protein kinase n=1 Tax=Rosa chinensis TaxID=74649 RepID=A0A2P6Q3C8_ROSCH|nr:putative non-specific serine/threonine protein kinase [Rosa chinensis]